MIFDAKLPDHHLFKGKKPNSIKVTQPFIIEKGKQQLYTAYTLQFDDCSIEIWTDGRNYWINNKE